MSAPT